MAARARVLAIALHRSLTHRSLTRRARHAAQAILRLLAERAALAEEDVLAYATHAASWAEFISLNPLLAVAAAYAAAHERARARVALRACAGRARSADAPHPAVLCALSLAV